MLERMDHVNIVVADLARMASFYRDLLGMRETRRVSIQGEWIESLTGYAGARADVIYLEANADVALELIQYHTPAGQRPAGLAEPNTPGLRHLAFRVVDLDDAVAKLKGTVDFLSEIQRVPTQQVEFSRLQKRIIYCRDPEGNLLELCDFC